MNVQDRVRLQHMLDAALEARLFIENRKRDDLNADRQLVLALTKTVEIIGEAASRVSTEFKQEYPELPWVDIVGMRNRLIHAYFDINLDILWDTVVYNLPPLIDVLQELLQADASNG